MKLLVNKTRKIEGELRAQADKEREFLLSSVKKEQQEALSLAKQAALIEAEKLLAREKRKADQESKSIVAAAELEAYKEMERIKLELVEERVQVLLEEQCKNAAPRIKKWHSELTTKYKADEVFVHPCAKIKAKAFNEHGVRIVTKDAILTRSIEREFAKEVDCLRLKVLEELE